MDIVTASLHQTLCLCDTCVATLRDADICRADVTADKIVNRAEGHVVGSRRGVEFGLVEPLTSQESEVMGNVASQSSVGSVERLEAAAEKSDGKASGERRVETDIKVFEVAEQSDFVWDATSEAVHVPFEILNCVEVAASEEGDWDRAS